MASCAKLSARSTLETLRSGELTEAQARSLFQQGEEAVVFALLEMSKRLAEAQEKNGSWATPSTPSGMVPVYEKPPAKRRGKKRPGGKRGHPGSRRPSPERVDWQVEHRADCCPDCGSRLRAAAETRVRYTEDIPDVQPETTEHTIHRDWCPQCRKKVEPPVTAALPGCLLGNRVLALSAWLHYALGNTLSQIVEVFNFHLQFKITPGGLVQMWQRLQELLYGWYEQIQQEALDSAVLHGDETGWRNDGQTNWLWSFGNQHLTYYLIDRSRGSPALAKFFIQEFAGTLVTDFWGAYNAVSCAARQTCLVHLLRELEQTEQYKSPGALVGLRQEAAATGGGRDPAVAAEAGAVRRDIRFPPGLPRPAVGRARRRAVGRPPLPTLGKAPQAASVRLVHVPRSSRSSLRQQPRRTIDPPGGDPPQKQLRQPKPTRHRLPSRADERLPHAQTTRPRPDSNRRPGD